jgi:hypothetical protein
MSTQVTRTVTGSQCLSLLRFVTGQWQLELHSSLALQHHPFLILFPLSCVFLLLAGIPTLDFYP